MSSSKVRDAVAGSIAASAAIGASEAAAGLLPGVPSLVESIGDWVIDVVPAPVKDLAIALFDTNDKLALVIGIVVVTMAIGTATGMAARRRFGIGIAVFGAFGLAGAAAAARVAGVSVALIPAGLAIIVGLSVLSRLLGGDVGDSQRESDRARRRFLIGAGAFAGLAVAGAGVGRYLLEASKRSAAARDEVVLPVAAEVASPPGLDADFGLPGLSPTITPNSDFYRIDTALSVPKVDIQDWSLSISGMVDRPYSIDLFDLLGMRMVERYVTLSCVSNRVGGDLVGNAKWLGVRLTDVLDRAGVAAGAEQIVGRSVDGFTVGFPVAAAYDGREALVAMGMNGEPLPFEHGFPARLVVAGLYGYVSATKWLSEIELTTWGGFDAYWVPRGWAKEAPVKTQSRIDTPRGQRVTAGRIVVAGVAWAPHRGISRVEVQLGRDAPWVDAEMSEPLSDDAWRQWNVEWDATEGNHSVSVRATDGEGALQDEATRPPAPDGATGWHTVSVGVDP